MNHTKAQLIALKYALRLEIRGFSRRGPSAYSRAKSQFNLVGNKRQVYDALCEIVARETGETGGEELAMLRPNFKIRNSVSACVDDIAKALKENLAEKHASQRVAEFEIILASAMDLGESPPDAFEYALGVTELDRTLSYREASDAKSHLLKHTDDKDSTNERPKET